MAAPSTDCAERLVSLQDEIAGLRQRGYPDSYDILDLLTAIVSEMQRNTEANCNG